VYGYAVNRPSLAEVGLSKKKKEKEKKRKTDQTTFLLCVCELRVSSLHVFMPKSTAKPMMSHTHTHTQTSSLLLFTVV